MSHGKSLSTSTADRLNRALESLEGLSVGDAFGQQFFIPGMIEFCLEHKDPPPPTWVYTDDTEMALAIFEVLRSHCEIDQAELARRFAARYVAAPNRGYGKGAEQLLEQIAAGEDWRASSRQLFHGSGSYGNGGAMRVAPLGAYFADDMQRVVEQAALSAEVTHSHPEGIAGTIAVAVAAAWSVQEVSHKKEISGIDLLQTVLKWTPAGATRQAIQKALDVPLDEWEYAAANVLGNGGYLSETDTVPFCLWCAAAHINSYSNALWAAAKVGGDIDTNCAIIGGIVGSAVGKAGIPTRWIRSRETLKYDSAV